MCSSSNGKAEVGSPLLIYDSQGGGFCMTHKARWSEHYRTNPREPDNTTLAPWVTKYWGLDTATTA
jgi:hypothetical protein